MESIKFGDIEYFTLLGLQTKLKARDYDKLGLMHLDILRYEIDMKLEVIHAKSKS